MLGQNQLIKTIEDCEVGKYADLELVIIEAHKPVHTKLCSKCWHSICKEWCKKQDYKPMGLYNYDAADLKSNPINVCIKPWSKVNPETLQTMHTYRIRGKIHRKFNGKFDLVCEKVESIDRFTVERTQDQS